MNSCLTLPEKARIARSFGKAAASYDRFAHFQRDIADRLLTGPLGSPAAILDLGSGTGYCARRLADRFPQAEITSLDIAEPMLAHARQRDGMDGHWVCGDAEGLPFRDNSFDLVVSSLTIQWCPAPVLIFRELSRVLKPAGKALVSTLAEQTLAELRASWASVDAFVHVNNFISFDAIQDAVALAEFSNAVFLSDRQRVFYDSLQALTRELKGIGAHNLNTGQAHGLTGRSKLRNLKSAFEQHRVHGRGIPVTYDAVLIELTR